MKNNYKTNQPELTPRSRALKNLLLLFASLLTCSLLNAQTPVAYYPFTGNANDAIGPNHGTVNGATLTTDRFGVANSTYNFDGVDDRITAPLATTVTDNFSLHGWVRLNAITPSGFQMLFYNG